MLERLLVVGLGSIGKRHARLARELFPELQVVALRHRGGATSDAPGIDHCVSDVSEALRFKPQAAAICSPASHHLPVALELARAGVHLLIEKPLAERTAGVDELIEVCRQRDVTLMVGYNLRLLASLQKFRELLHAGQVGRWLSVRAEVGQFLPSWRPDSDYRKTVSAQAALGGGALLELSHEIDYLRWLFGEVDWVSATLRKQSALELDVEDTAHLLLGFAGHGEQPGMVATLSMDFIRHDTVRTCTVIGERGTLRWNAIEGVVEMFAAGAGQWDCLFRQAPQRDESYRAEWGHFVRSIADRTPPPITGEDGLAVLRIIEAARRSSAAAAVATVEHS